ncbi:MAG TPA: hypothetical protein VH268_12005 [Solirubrobacterales bacterium]|nr:hypothetical protein [Solirubrobacterales bacterium]
MNHLPAYLWVLTYAEVASIAAATAYALYRGGQAAGLGDRTSTRIGLGAALLFGGWLAVSSWLAGSGAYRSRLGHGVPWLPLAILGFLGVLIASTRLPSIRGALTAPGAGHRLLSPHSFRAGGIVFVIAMLMGKLPALFAVPAGFGDIAVAMAAVWVTRGAGEGPRPRALLWFTLLGIADLVSALTLGALTGFLQVVHVSPAATLNADLPLVLIPTVGVPLLLAMHLGSLDVLFRARADSVRQLDRPRPAGAAQFPVDPAGFSSPPR